MLAETASPYLPNKALVFVALAFSLRLNLVSGDAGQSRGVEAGDAAHGGQSDRADENRLSSALVWYQLDNYLRSEQTDLNMLIDAWNTVA